MQARDGGGHAGDARGPDGGSRQGDPRAARVLQGGRAYHHAAPRGAAAPHPPSGHAPRPPPHAVPGGQRLSREGHLQLRNGTGGHGDAQATLSLPRGHHAAHRVRRCRHPRGGPAARGRQGRPGAQHRMRRGSRRDGSAESRRAPRHRHRPLALPRHGRQGEPPQQRVQRRSGQGCLQAPDGPRGAQGRADLVQPLRQRHVGRRPVGVGDHPKFPARSGETSSPRRHPPPGERDGSRHAG